MEMSVFITHAKLVVNIVNFYVHVCVCGGGGVGKHSQYCDSLQAGRAGDRIPLRRDLPRSPRPALGPIQLIPIPFPGGEAAGPWP